MIGHEIGATVALLFAPLLTWIERRVIEIGGRNQTAAQREQLRKHLAFWNVGSDADEPDEADEPERVERGAGGIDRDGIVRLLREAVAAGVDPVHLLAQAGAEISGEQQAQLLEKLGGGLDTQSGDAYPRCGACGRPHSPGAVNCPSCGHAVSQKSATSVREWRDQAVHALLGREPISKREEVDARAKIHAGNPGLAQACRDEEAAERRGEG